MSTLEKAIELLQEMPESKPEAVYMYIRFVDSQTDSNEEFPAPNNKSIDSLMGIAHEYANPALMEKETVAFENAVIEKYSPESTLEKGNGDFRVLCHLPERCRRTLIIKRNWRRQGMKNTLVLFDTNIILDVLEKRLPFYDSSKSALEKCVFGGVTGYIALHSISNITEHQ